MKMSRIESIAFADALNATYSAQDLEYNEWMDHQCDQANMNKLDYDLQRGTGHVNRKRQDMDRHIVDLHKIYQKHIEHWSCTLDDNRAVRPNIPLNMNKPDDFERHGIRYINRMAMANMDYLSVWADML